MSDFFVIFGDTYLPMSYTLCTIYLCTMSDFPWHTYLPKKRTSFMDVPLMYLNLSKKPYFIIWFNIQYLLYIDYDYFMCLSWKIHSHLIFRKSQNESPRFFCNSDMLMMLNQIEYVSSKIHRKIISVNLK